MKATKEGHFRSNGPKKSSRGNFVTIYDDLP